MSDTKSKVTQIFEESQKLIECPEDAINELKDIESYCEDVYIYGLNWNSKMELIRLKSNFTMPSRDGYPREGDFGRTNFFELEDGKVIKSEDTWYEDSKTEKIDLTTLPKSTRKLNEILPHYTILRAAKGKLVTDSEFETLKTEFEIKLFDFWKKTMTWNPKSCDKRLNSFRYGYLSRFVSDNFCYCGFKTATKKSRKRNENYGREYAVCQFDNCKFFKWND